MMLAFGFCSFGNTSLSPRGSLCCALIPVSMIVKRTQQNSQLKDHKKEEFVLSSLCLLLALNTTSSLLKST